MDDIAMIFEREAGMPDNVPQIGVGFCLYPLKDQAKSDAAGRDVYDDVEFVRIQVPGDRETTVFQPATAQHKARFPKAYELFKRLGVTAQQGTPLEQWPAISRGMALTLKAAGIPTVEALCEVHDGNLEKLGAGARELRTKARGWVAQATDAAAAQKLEQEKQQLMDVIGDLQAQITDLAGRLGEDPPELLVRAPKPAKGKGAKKKPPPAARKKAA